MNRMVIPAANGPVNLSVPLVGGRENKRVVGEVRIDNSRNWQVNHWRTITSAYGRSPWFEFYEQGLQQLYHKPYERLYEWDRDILHWVFKALRVPLDLQFLWEPPAAPELPESCLPSNYQQPRFTHDLPVYTQVFQDRIGFQQNMSILDLLVNEGNNSRSLLV